MKTILKCKIWNADREIFPLWILKNLSIFRSEKGYLGAALPKEIGIKNCTWLFRYPIGMGEAWKLTHAKYLGILDNHNPTQYKHMTKLFKHNNSTWHQKRLEYRNLKLYGRKICYFLLPPFPGRFQSKNVWPFLARYSTHPARCTDKTQRQKKMWNLLVTIEPWCHVCSTLTLPVHQYLKCNARSVNFKVSQSQTWCLYNIYPTMRYL